MKRSVWILPLLLLAGGIVLAEEAGEAKKEPAKTSEPAGKADPKTLDGMSILGNQETPKALVIVPWKSSELGAALGVAPMLDDSRAPVDREVFLRSLSYYEIRSETTRHDGAPSRGGKDAADGSQAAQVPPAARRSKS